MISKARAFVAAAIFLFASLSFAGEVFSFQNLRDSTVFGPYRLRYGEKINIGGTTYEVLTSSAGRVSFKSLSNGVVYGPIQTVDKRIGVIGNGSYRLLEMPDDYVSNTPAHAPHAARTAAPPSEPFVPQPPAMPELIEVPEQKPQTLVPPQDLRPLPKTEAVFRILGWYAPIDNSSVDWKIDSSKSGDGEIERSTIGADVEWNNWIASASFSPSVECGDIAKGGGTITGASLEDGIGWSIAGGYRRAVLSEGGWIAKIGLRGQIRQESGDLSVQSVSRFDETDTNGVVSVRSVYRTRTSSMTVRELSLWIDMEISYSSDDWGLYTLLSFQPISEFSVSGSIYSGGHLSIDAERPLPLDVTAGCWYGFNGWRIFADITLAADTRFRMGCGFDL